jgi:hypothetical protein
MCENRVSLNQYVAVHIERDLMAVGTYDIVLI